MLVRPVLSDATFQGRSISFERLPRHWQMYLNTLLSVTATANEEVPFRLIPGSREVFLGFSVRTFSVAARIL